MSGRHFLDVWIVYHGKKFMMEGFFLLAIRGICKFNLWFRYAIDALIGNCRVRMEFGIELISYCGD